MRFGGAYALLVMAIVLMVAGFALRNWELISLVLPITLYMMLASMLRPAADISITAERSMRPTKVMEGDDAEVRLVVENKGSRPHRFEIHDIVPRTSELVSGSNRHPISLAPGQSVSFNYTLRFNRRGKKKLGPLVARWGDPLFVFKEEKYLDVVSEVTIIPYIHEIRKKTLTPEKLRIPVGSSRSRFRGVGTDFHSIRDYYDGDELKRINWKATARFDKMLVNDFESDRSGDITIILDATGNDNSPAETEALNRAMEAAVSISSSVLRNRHRVGMIIVGQYIDMVMPAFGRRQFYRIVDRVLSVSPGEVRSLWTTLSSLRGRFPFESTLVIVSPLTGSGIVEGVRMLSHRGHSIAIVSPSPLEIEKRALNPSQSLDLAYRIHRVRRENLVSELRNHCRVYDWNTEEPLEKHLVEVRRSSTGRTWA